MVKYVRKALDKKESMEDFGLERDNKKALNHKDGNLVFRERKA